MQGYSTLISTPIIVYTQVIQKFLLQRAKQITYFLTGHVAMQMANGIQPFQMEDNLYFHQESISTKTISVFVEPN